MEKDPIKKIEEMVREMHDGAGRYTQPVLKRYPLLFTLLFTLGLAGTLHGFELITDNIALFRNHPTVLMGIGIFVLIFTGTLYKALGKHE